MNIVIISILGLIFILAALYWVPLPRKPFNQIYAGGDGGKCVGFRPQGREKHSWHGYPLMNLILCNLLVRHLHAFSNHTPDANNT